MNTLTTTRDIYRAWKQGMDQATIRAKWHCSKKSLLLIIAHYMGVKVQSMFEVEANGVFCYGLGCRYTEDGLVCQLSWADKGFPAELTIKGKTYTRCMMNDGVTYDAKFNQRP